MNLAKLLPAFVIAFAAASPAAVAEESAQYKNLLTPLLETETDIVEQPIVYPSGTPKVTSAIVVVPPGVKPAGTHTKCRCSFTSSRAK